MFCGMADPLALLGALAHGDGRQSPRRRDRAVEGRLHRLRLVAARPRSVADAAPPSRCCRCSSTRSLPPEVKATPEAPAAARKRARRDGPPEPPREDRRGHVRRHGRALGPRWDLEARPPPRSRSSVSGCSSRHGRPDPRRISAKEGDVLATFIWFAILYGLSGQLNALGFMGFLGAAPRGALGGLPWLAAYVLLLVRLRPPPLPVRQPDGPSPRALRRFHGVGVTARRSGATARLSPSTSRRTSSRSSRPRPPARTSSFVGSGYLTQGELYQLGTMTTVVHFLVSSSSGPPGSSW